MARDHRRQADRGSRRTSVGCGSSASSMPTVWRAAMRCSGLQAPAARRPSPSRAARGSARCRAGRSGCARRHRRTTSVQRTAQRVEHGAVEHRLAVGRCQRSGTPSALPACIKVAVVAFEQREGRCRPVVQIRCGSAFGPIAPGPARCPHGCGRHACRTTSAPSSRRRNPWRFPGRPCTSTDTRTKSCGQADKVTAPKRNGSRNRTGRTPRSTARTVSSGAASMGIERTLAHRSAPATAVHRCRSVRRS